MKHKEEWCKRAKHTYAQTYKKMMNIVWLARMVKCKRRGVTGIDTKLIFHSIV